MAATVVVRDDGWHVTCPHCLRFTLDPYLMDLFREAAQRGDKRVLHLLPRLSEASRQTASEGGRLNLAVENGKTAVPWRRFCPRQDVCRNESDRHVNTPLPL
jgi:hypothetical protein